MRTVNTLTAIAVLVSATLNTAHADDIKSIWKEAAERMFQEHPTGYALYNSKAISEIELYPGHLENAISLTPAGKAAFPQYVATITAEHQAASQPAPPPQTAIAWTDATTPATPAAITKTNTSATTTAPANNNALPLAPTTPTPTQTAIDDVQNTTDANQNSAIKQNRASITTNAAGIQQNADDVIAALQKTGENRAFIDANTQRAADNTTAIATNKAGVTKNAADVADVIQRMTANASALLDHDVEIAANRADIDQAAADVADTRKAADSAAQAAQKAHVEAKQNRMASGAIYRSTLQQINTLKALIGSTPTAAPVDPATLNNAQKNAQDAAALNTASNAPAAGTTPPPAPPAPTNAPGLAPTTPDPVISTADQAAAHAARYGAQVTGMQHITNTNKGQAGKADKLNAQIADDTAANASQQQKAYAASHVSNTGNAPAPATVTPSPVIAQQVTPPTPSAAATAAAIQKTAAASAPQPVAKPATQPAQQTPPAPAAKPAPVPQPVAQATPPRPGKQRKKPTAIAQQATTPAPVQGVMHDTTSKRQILAAHAQQRQINAAVNAFNQQQQSAPAVTTAPQTVDRYFVNTQDDAARTLAADAYSRSQANSAAIVDQQQQIQNNRDRITDSNRRIDGLKKQQAEDRKEYRAGIAGVGALSAVPEVGTGQKFFIGAGVSEFAGTAGIAVGASSWISDSVKVKVGVAGSSQGDAVFNAGIGIGY
ncbi:hypothetical protein CUW27_20750 [Salmonella enterica]|nr:hypothetical protein [Salmonella enterica]